MDAGGSFSEFERPQRETVHLHQLQSLRMSWAIELLRLNAVEPAEQHPTCWLEEI
jgi:hypothetical protein